MGAIAASAFHAAAAYIKDCTEDHFCDTVNQPGMTQAILLLQLMAEELEALDARTNHNH